MASASESSAGGTRVENILKALNECLEMNPNPSESLGHNSTPPANHENSNTLHVQLNDKRSHVTKGVASDGENCLSSEGLKVKNASSNESQPSTDHKPLDNSDSNRNEDGAHSGHVTNGLTRDDISNGNTNGDEPETRSSGGISNKKSTHEESGTGAGVTPETTANGSVGNETGVKNSTTSAEATGGDTEDNEEDEESLLAQKLATVMEKLEAYRATRDYVMALASKLKEENARYDAEYGNIGDGNTEADRIAAGNTGSSTDVVNGNAHNGNTQNKNDVHNEHTTTDSIIEISQIASVGSPTKLTEISNKAIDTETQRENKTLHSEESNDQNKASSVKTQVDRHVDCKLYNEKPLSNGDYNQSRKISKSKNDREAEDDEENDDEDIDYDDYYYDVAEDIDYVYEIDYKTGNEAAAENNLLNAYDATAENQQLSITTDGSKSRAVNKPPVPDDRDIATTAQQTDKSRSSDEQNQAEWTANNASDTIYKSSHTVSSETASADRTEQQPGGEQEKISEETAVSQPPPLGRSHEEKNVKGVLDLNRVERLNVMLRLQTEFAKMQLQIVEMQENMRAATTALSRLAALESGDGDED